MTNIISMEWYKSMKDPMKRLEVIEERLVQLEAENEFLAERVIVMETEFMTLATELRDQLKALNDKV